MGAHRARGLTLVELLVGSAVGLLVVAAATSVVMGQLRESRQLQLDARLMQDLRSAADVVARDLRRAGYWGTAASGIRGDASGPVASNPYAVMAPSAAASDGVHLAYSRDAAENDHVDAAETFGFRLRAGVLEMQLGAANWQALTDSGTLVVTAFTIEPRIDEVSLEAFCELPCPAASSTCPPRTQVRSFAIGLTARSTSDAAVVRSVRGSARVRNDAVVGQCAA